MTVDVHYFSLLQFTAMTLNINSATLILFRGCFAHDLCKAKIMSKKRQLLVSSSLTLHQFFYFPSRRVVKVFYVSRKQNQLNIYVHLTAIFILSASRQKVLETSLLRIYWVFSCWRFHYLKYFITSIYISINNW